MSRYIIAHDLGTSGNKATLYNLEGQLCASSVYEYPCYYPAPGCVEQNPEDWWKAICVTTKELIDKAKIDNAQVACISFSAQMMGCLLVDKDGKALRHMITWADTRSTKQADRMGRLLGMEEVYKITGHRISASYSAAKLLWVKDNQPDIYKRAYKMLHAKDYIIKRLTGNFVTDYSDASGTNMFDLSSKKWSEDILKELDIPIDLLPEAHPSTDIAGTITKEASKVTGLMVGTPVVIGGGDGSCACVGAGVVEEGRTYNVIGTSSWISTAKTTPIFDSLMRTFNWIHLDPNLYTPCGTMQAAAYSYNWGIDLFCEMEKEKSKSQGLNLYKEINQLVENSPIGANGVMFLPYLLGERSPRWNPEATGTFIGLTGVSNKGDAMRAIMEGVGYNLKVILDALEEKIDIEEVIVIGGGAKGRVWLQILSDIWQKELKIPQYVEEATSLGAAICGGVGIKAYDNFKVIDKFNKPIHSIKPNEGNKDKYKSLYAIFNQTYRNLEDIYGMLRELS